MVFSQSLWFLNFILIVLHFTLVITFIFLPHHKEQALFLAKKVNTFLPKTKDKKGEENPQEIKDIFHTLTKNDPVKNKQTIFTPSNLVTFIEPPLLPQSIPFEKKDKRSTPLIPPLQITLHGTILQKTPLEYKAIIANNMTKGEKIYNIGDIIEDAQIIFIAKDNVTLIRANGQEEKVYLLNKEKIKDVTNEKISFENSIEKINNEITIKKGLFLKKVPHLDSFITELGLVIEFKEGLPIGCMIQNADPEGLPHFLGFKQNDIILAIDSYPVKSIDERIDALSYIQEKIINGLPFSFTTTFLREGIEQEIKFRILP